jgi:hypothetical protein
MTAPDTGMGAAPAEMMAPEAVAPDSGGSVMISMPEDAFNAIRELINQLAMGVDALAQSVGQQKSAGETPVAAPTEAAAAPADEDFLKGIAEAGSMR